MKINYDYNLKNWIVEISETEQTEINNIFKNLKTELDEYLINEREDLYYEISPFITNEAIKSKLANLKYHIINDLNYNTEFKDVFYLNNGFVVFVESTVKYHFANSYNILDDSFKAILVLRNILRVKLIDYLIENEFNENNSKDFVFTTDKQLAKNISTPQPKFNYNIEHLALFKPHGFELFNFLNKHLEIKAETVKYTVIYHFLNTDVKVIIGDQSAYLNFTKPYLKKVQFNRMDFDKINNPKYTKNEPQLTELYDEFKKTHNF